MILINDRFVQDSLISKAKDRYFNFILKCIRSNKQASLTIKDGYQSPFALCFTIFGLHLLKNKSIIESNKDVWIVFLKENLDSFKESRILLSSSIADDKPYLQLLTFTLSAL